MKPMGRRYKSDPAFKPTYASPAPPLTTTKGVQNVAGQSPRTRTEQASRSAHQSFEFLREKARDLVQASRPIGASAWKAAKQVSVKTLETARDVSVPLLKKPGQVVVDKTKNGIRAASTTIRETTRSTADNVRSRIRTALSAWTLSIRNTALRTVRVVTEPFARLTANLSQSGSSVWNRFWWWSLSAVAVYGLATTVPKELIRRGRLQQETADNDKAST
jgi:hypothetical protein